MELYLFRCYFFLLLHFSFLFFIGKRNKCLLFSLLSFFFFSFSELGSCFFRCFYHFFIVSLFASPMHIDPCTRTEIERERERELSLSYDLLRVLVDGSNWDFFPGGSRGIGDTGSQASHSGGPSEEARGVCACLGPKEALCPLQLVGPTLNSHPLNFPFFKTYC